MQKKKFILELYRAKNSVFTFKEISLLLNETNRDALKAKVNYYVKKGDIKQVRRGIYVKPEYDKFELAAKIYMPSYISLETILQEAGIIFQHYEKIFVVSYLTRLITVDGQEIMLRKIKNDILLNSSGIIISENYAKAGKERAFLDCLYLYHDYHFDNLEALDKDKVFGLADIYQNKQLLKKVRELIK
jgi:predicted transcriptional regulator of viral defense system